MSRRSVLARCRARWILTALQLIPVPFIVFRSLETIKGNPALWDLLYFAFLLRPLRFLTFFESSEEISVQSP